VKEEGTGKVSYDAIWSLYPKMLGSEFLFSFTSAILFADNC
jgi:hypothetical protein